MKKSTKNQKQRTISYTVALAGDIAVSSLTHKTDVSGRQEFKDKNPLKARGKAFEFVENFTKTFTHLSQQGFPSLVNYSELNQEDWECNIRLSFTITLKVTSNDGTIEYEKPLNNVKGQNIAIETLKAEYSFYKDFGYETGDTMKLENGETIIRTDPNFIYDRS